MVLLVGRDFDQAKLGRIPENIFIHQSVDQLAVLERADLFITHGGMNSVNEALCYTMPMVVVPMADDQPMVGARIAKLGLGTVVSRRKINGQDTRACRLEDSGRQTNCRQCQQYQ